MNIRAVVVMVVMALALIAILLVPNKQEYVPPQQPGLSIPRSWTSEELTQLIVETARKHQINEIRFLKTAQCESSLRASVVGDDGNSIGLFQIHLPSHPTVTEEQAMNPEWAVEWAAEKFKKNPKIWVCYNILYGESTRKVLE